MFPKLALLALAGASAVQALSLNTPTDVTSGGRTNLTWTADQSDPVFSIELHHPSLLQDIALANNVDPSAEQIEILMPILLVRDDQYVFRAVNISNINQEYARTGNFFVGDTVSSSASSQSNTATNPPSGASTTASVPQTQSSARPTSSGTGTGTGSNSASGTGTTSGDAGPTNGPLNGRADSTVVNLGLLVAAVGAVAAAL